MYLITNRINKIFLTIFVFSMLYSGLSAQEIKCITPPLSNQQFSEYLAQLQEYLNNDEDHLPSNSIHIWFHVILINGGGDVPNSWLNDQIDQLNLDFAGTTLSFVLEGVDGDGLSDTPVHIVNQYCPPESTNTCPQHPGNDPVHNYLNYVDDGCMWEFTPMQKDVMLGGLYHGME